jgi:hypothetical protein
MNSNDRLVKYHASCENSTTSYVPKLNYIVDNVDAILSKSASRLF